MQIITWRADMLSAAGEIRCCLRVENSAAGTLQNCCKTVIVLLRAFSQQIVTLSRIAVHCAPRSVAQNYGTVMTRPGEASPLLCAVNRQA